MQAQAAAIAPLAALSLGAAKTKLDSALQFCLENFSYDKLSAVWTRLQDSANYAFILPPVGSQQISYARFLELLSNRKIKRIILMDNATCAIVEVQNSAPTAVLVHSIHAAGVSNSWTASSQSDRIEPDSPGMHSQMGCGSYVDLVLSGAQLSEERSQP